MIDPDDLRRLVIRPILGRMELHSRSAENLLLGTSLAESVVDGDTHLKQISGPALGIYQIEPATHDDVWQHFLAFRHPLELKVKGFLVGHEDKEVQLIWNLAYQTAIARVIYLRVKERLPEADDLWSIALYWKTYWNTSAGAGTIEGFLRKAGAYL